MVKLESFDQLKNVPVIDSKTGLPVNKVDSFSRAMDIKREKSARKITIPERTITVIIGKR